jgi:ribosomal protein S18 acetylase RimI-like enzyme
MDTMTEDLEPLLRYWRAQDDAFERVEPFWWGAVVSDGRFPRIQEGNYARVETRQRLRLAEVEEPLLPSMQRTAFGRSHVLVFHPEDQTDLLAEASTRGEKLTWDLVMQHTGVPPAVHDVIVEEAAFDDELVTSAHRASLRWFDVTDPAIVDEMVRCETTVMIPAGRRWFVLRHDGEPVAFAGLLVLEGVGYVDNVVTFPEARRRGYASALTARAVEAARAAGADRTYLMADPNGTAKAIYERLGFRPVTQIASWISSPR